MYVSQGGGTTFYKYSISANSWTPLATIPASISWGSMMIRNGSDDSIYMLQGGGGTGFFKYSISANSWTALTVTPGAIDKGAYMLRNAGDDNVYTMAGNGTGFYKYSVTANTWATMAVLPGSASYGAMMIRNGSEDYIYAALSTGTGFYRFSISAGTWTSLTAMPTTFYGGQITRFGSDDTVYVLMGNQGSLFYKYSIAGNSWTQLTNSLGPIAGGSTLLRNGSGNDIYVVEGNAINGSNTGFYKYSISGNSWTNLAASPGPVAWGGTGIADWANGYIYVQPVGSSGFFRYSISGSSWTVLGLNSAPGSVYYGGFMIRNGSDNDIYVMQGGLATGFFKYSIAGNSWTSLTAVPAAVSYGGFMIRNGSDNDIYVLGAGSGSGAFYKYSISGNSWTALTSVPGTVSYGAAMIRNGSDNDIYVMQGGLATGFFKYSIAGNSWTTLTIIPGAIGYGATIMRNGSDNDIYVLQGNYASGFYKYSISGNNWTILTVVPGTVSSAITNSNMIRNGSDNDIYVLQGNNGSGFYKYSISGNSWTTLSTVPGTNYTNALVRNGLGNDIYAIQGVGFYKYSIASNTWTTLPTLPTVPAATGSGSFMICNGLDSNVYILAGNNSNKLYKYTIDSAYQSSSTFESQALDLGTKANFSDLKFSKNSTDISSAVASWRMDGNWNDSVGINNGTRSGSGAAFSTPKFGLNSGNFNGSTDYVDATNSANFTFASTDSFSVEAWIKTTHNGVVYNFTDPNGGGAWQMMAMSISGGKARFQWRSSDVVYKEMAGSTNVIDGNWHHLVGVRDYANSQVKLYVDGVSDATPVSYTTSGNFNANHAINIGSFVDANLNHINLFNGQIDEVTVYKSALTGPATNCGAGANNQVCEHYNDSLKFQITANNDNATWNYIGPDGTNGTYFTYSGVSTPSALNGNRYVRYKAYFSIADTTIAPILNSVILDYTQSTHDASELFEAKFNNSAKADYAAGSPYPLINYNTSYDASGKFNQGMYIDSADGDVLKYSTTGNLDYHQGTVEFWFKPDWGGGDVTVGQHRLFCTYDTDPNKAFKNQICIGKLFNPSAAIAVTIMDSSGDGNWNNAKTRSVTIPTSDSSITAGTWHHLVFTYDTTTSPTTMHVYLDGSNSGESLVANGGNGQMNGIGPEMHLGQWGENQWYSQKKADATFDDLKIYNRVLSSDEVLARSNFTNENDNVGIVNNLIMHEPADGTAIWSKLDWNTEGAGSIPSGTNIKFRTRSAATQNGLASATWSGYNAVTGAALTGTPDSSWIEAEASLWSNDGSVTPTLSDFKLTYNVNAPPIITVNSAAQNTDGTNFGKVIINYGLTDLDDVNEQVYLFYQPQATTLTGAIQSTDPPPQTISASTTTGFPASGILSIGAETFTYDSKTSNSFHITVRHESPLNNERAQNHAIGEDIFVKALDANVTGLGAKTLNTGVPNSLTNQALIWDVKTELPNIYYPTAKIRILSDDNEFVYSTGTADQSLILDTNNPTASSIKINNDDAYTHSYTVNLNLATTDNSAIKVKVSNNADLSADGLNNNSGQWLDYVSAINNWNLPQNGDGTYVVYYKFRDVYGNGDTDSISNDTIIKSTPPAPTITSATQGPDGKVTILYNLADTIAPPTGQTKFNIYLKYAADGTNFTLVTDTYLTDELGQTLNVTSAGNGKTIVWDPTTQFPGIVKLSGQHKLRLIVDDQNPSVTVADPTAANLNFADANVLERIAKSDYATFKLDTAAPTGTYITINNDDTYTHSSTVNLNLVAVDDSNVKVKISNNQNLSADGLNNNSGQWLDFVAIINNWNLPAGDGSKTVYYKFKDEFGNIVPSDGSDIIVKSSPPVVAINSVIEQFDGSVQIKYALTDAVTPPTGQTYFNVYAKYSNTGSDSDLTLIGSSDPTAIAGNTIVSIADGSEQTITWYPTKETFSNDLYKNAASHKLVLYADDLNSGVAAGNAERFASASKTDFILDTKVPVKTYFYTDSNNDGNDDDYTQSSNVKLLISATDNSTLQYRFSNTAFADGDATAWSTLAASPVADNVASFDLAAGEGERTVYGQLRDAYGNVTNFQKSIYKVSTPNVTVNTVAQSITPETYGKVYVDYNIQDSLYSSLDVVMKYCTAGCDDNANWHEATSVTSVGVQTIVPGESRNIISIWDAQSQLNGQEFSDARFRVYASDGSVVPQENMYNPADEPGGTSNDVSTYDLVTLDFKAGTASGNAIVISGKTSTGKIGTPQLEQGVKLNLSITDLSDMKVQFSNDGNKFGISTNNQGAITGAFSDISANSDDPSAWLTYTLGNGISWTPDMSTQGDKTVYVRVRDKFGNMTIYSDTAILDTIAPTPPHFIVVDSSYYGIRYWVTIGWDLFTQNSADYADLPDESLSSPANTAYILERKIVNKEGKLVDNTGNPLPDINQANTNYAETLVSYPRNTSANDFVDKNLIAYNVENPVTYYYRVRAIDAVGNYSASTWQSIVPQGLDAVPPEISSNGPSAEAQATTATISWLTDKLSNSIVQFSSTADYKIANPTTYLYEQGKSEEFNTVHSVDVIGLQPTTTYHYRVKSVSSFGKESYSTDKTFTTALPEDSKTDPIIYTPEVQTLGTSASTVTITWKTDRYAYGEIWYGADANTLDQKSGLSPNANKDHWVTLSTLDPKTKYYFKARSVDIYGNEIFGPVQSFITTATNSIDTEAAISAVVISDITMTSAVVSWTSVNITQYDFNYGKSTSYGTVVSDKSSSSTTIHTVKLQNLEQGTSYHFRIQGTDDNNATYLSDDYIFQTITLPEIKNIRISDITENSLTAAWETNVATDSQVEYRINAIDTPRVEAMTELVTSHSVKLQNLDSNVTYSLRIIVRDAFGNQAISLPNSIKTKVDVTPPKIMQVKAETAASLSQDGKVQAIISWNTDEPATTQVIFATTSNGEYDNQTVKDENPSMTHIVIVPNLVGSSTYHYRAVSVDKAGNEARSSDYTILTPRKKKSLVDIIITNMEQQFGWLRKFGAFQ